MERVDVLIIDDEEKFAAMLSKRIGLRGHSSHICYNGKTALQWIQKKENFATLILLDLRLPDMYGVEVLTEIKKINPASPVIILTGHGTEQDRQQCEQLGAYMFIHKPLKIDELMAIMKRIKESPE
jgi:DNA-binding NtrC family response regulator